MKDHYRTLGVPRTASADEIKQAYRRQAAQHHPDRGGDKTRFQDLQEAYSVLGDPARRQEYDNPGMRININSGMPNFNFDEIFEMFGARFGRGPDMRTRTMRIQLWITLADVIRGGPRVISLGGNGSNTVEINIPAGIQDGDSVRYPGLGPNGSDLVALFRVQPEPNWARDANHLVTEIQIDFWDLILGRDVVITMPDQRRVEVQVPPDTQPNTVLRMRGLGVPDRNGTMGDLMCRVQARLPPDIPAELRQQIAQLRNR